MNIGQLLGSAGVVGQAWRQEEEAQRAAKQSQMALDEQSRLEALKSELSRTNLAAFQPTQVPTFGVQPGYAQQGMMPLDRGTPPVVPAAPTAPTAPVAKVPAAGLRSPTAPVTPPAAPASTAATPIGRWLETTGKAGGKIEDQQKLRAEIIDRFGPSAGILGVFRKQTDAQRQEAKQIMSRLDKMAPEEMQYVLATGELPKSLAKDGRAVAVPEDTLRRRSGTISRTDVPTTPTPTSQLTPAMVKAMIKVESAGRPEAVSEKGAVGLMQVLPTTAMDPGFGVPNVFDFAQQQGVPVGTRNAAEAKRLLADPQVGAAYGEQYMNALLQKYGGNMEYALAAYNAGPSRIDKWISAGADFTKLPKETQAYVPKVMAALGQAPATAAPAAAAPAAPAAAPGTPPQPLEVPKTQARNMEMAEFYLANPESVPMELQQLNQATQQQAELLTRQRNDAAQLAQVYMRSGTAQGIEAATRLRDTIGQYDANLMQLQQQFTQKQTYLQGMQGLRELAVGNDPRRLAGVLSQYMGTPVGIQPRSDGTYNYFVNGKKVQDGVSPSQLASMALKEFSPEARAASSASAALENELALKRKYGDSMVNAMRDIQKATIEGEYKIAEERAKQAQGKLTVDTSKGIAYFQKGNNVFVLTPDGKVVEIGGTKIETGPTARPVVGLNMGQ